MAYSNNPTDDNLSAEQRDIPSIPRRYTCDMGASADAKIFTLPVNVKVASIINGTDKTLSFYPSLYDQSTYTPASDLLTADTSSKILSVASGATYPLAMEGEFNTLIFKSASGAATGLVTVLTGSYSPAAGNGIGSLETRVVTAT